MKHIVVFGIFVADLCFFSNNIPLKGQTILGTKHIVGPGGKGSNQAIAAARAGGKVNFITKIGNDSNGNMALSLYKESGVNIESVIVDESLSTGVAGIMINETNGDNAINVIPGAAGHLSEKDIDDQNESFNKSEIFLTQLETPVEVTLYAIKKAKKLGCVTILNPAPAITLNKDIFEYLDFFTPNETEAGFYLKKDLNSTKDIESAGEEFLKMGIKNVIITLGDKGSYFANNDQKFFVDSFKLKSNVIDTTGAGDAYNGALCVALANNMNHKDSIEFATKVAGISTTKIGAANSMPTLKEIENY